MAAFQKFDLSLIPGTSETFATFATCAGGEPTEAEIVRWLNSHPPQGLDPDLCADCEEPLGRIGDNAVPFLTGAGGHIWLHHECHGEWMERRRAEAVKALKRGNLDNQKAAQPPPGAI